MSPRQAATAAVGRRRAVGITALLLVVAAVGMLLLVRARPDAEPFDPRSGAGSGTRGLVLLLRTAGCHRRHRPLRARSPAAIGGCSCCRTGSNDGQRARPAARSSTAGGVVVMADPDELARRCSSMTPAPISGRLPPFAGNDVDGQINVPLGECDVRRAAAPARRVRARPACASRADGADAVLRQRVAARSRWSHQRGQRPDRATRRQRAVHQRAAALRRQRTAGHGAAGTHRRVAGRASSSAPRRAKTAADIGTGEKHALRPRPAGCVDGARPAGDRVRRVRRSRAPSGPGGPCASPTQVPIAGSELVVATGNLMQRAHHARARRLAAARQPVSRAVPASSTCRPPPRSRRSTRRSRHAPRCRPATWPPCCSARCTTTPGWCELSSTLQEIREVALPDRPRDNEQAKEPTRER